MNYAKLLNQVHDNQLIAMLEANRDIFTGTFEEYGLDLFLSEGFHSDEPDTIVSFLTEALTDHEKYRADMLKQGSHSHYLERFLSHSPVAKAEFDQQRANDEKPGRIRFPVTLDASTSPPNESVVRHLRILGYETDPESYHKGLAHKTVTVGAPEKGIPMTEKKVSKKIGGILDETNAEQRIKNAFMHDPSRASSTKGNDFDIVISHHPHDVYGMSTDRGWSSCASMRPSERTADNAAKKMPEEINNQTHVAYLVPRGGNPDTAAVGRIALKRHDSITSGHATLIPETTVYSGGAPKGFKEEVNKLTAHLFPTRPGEIYKKNSEVYDDNSKPLYIPEDTSTEAMDATWKATKSSDRARSVLMSHIQPNTRYKSTGMTKVSKALGDLHSSMAAGDFVKSVSALHNYQQELDSIHTDHFKHISGRDNNPYRENVAKIAELFDYKNPEHMNIVSGRRSVFGYSAHNDVVDKTHHAMAQKPLHTVQDVVDNVKYHVAMNRGNLNTPIQYADRAIIAANHKLGGNAFRKIVTELDKHDVLSHETASHVFLSLPSTSRRGNLYDNVVGLADHPEIRGADNLIQQTVSEVGRKHPRQMATIFHNSRPETTKIIASKLGLDHKQVLKPYIKEFREQDAKIKASLEQKGK